MAPHQSYIAPSVQLIQLSTHLSFKAWTSLSLLNGPACQAPLSNRRSYLNLSSGESLRRVLTRSDGSEASAHCFMNWKKSLEKYSCTHSFHNRHDGEHTPSVRVPVSQTSLAAEPAKWLRTLLLWIWNFQPKKVPSLRRGSRGRFGLQVTTLQLEKLSQRLLLALLLCSFLLCFFEFRQRTVSGSSIGFK